jgi:CheY-like chemotaxis protein
VSAEPPLSGTADVGGGGRSVTVLVADDNEVACRLCRLALEKAGHKVLTASDGLEAVSLALANSPDVILMDDAMPGMHSLEAMRQIKEQRPGIAIVIASVHLNAGDRERFLAAGADDVLIKPFRLTDLTAVVAKLAANRGPQMKPSYSQNASIRKAGRDRILYALAHDLSSSLDLNELLRKVMERVIDLMHAARGFIVLVDPVTGEMSVVMAGGEADPEKSRSFVGSKTVIEQVVMTGRAVVSTDASLDDRFKGQQSVILQNLRSIIAVPLVTKGKVIGAVYVDSPFRAAIFEEKDKEFLQAIADLLAIAIDNARHGG